MSHMATPPPHTAPLATPCLGSWLPSVSHTVLQITFTKSTILLLFSLSLVLVCLICQAHNHLFILSFIQEFIEAHYVLDIALGTGDATMTQVLYSRDHTLDAKGKRNTDGS